MVNIPIRIGTSIREEIEAVYDDILQRACEMVLNRYGAGTLDVEDWFAAENELLRKPEIEITDMDRSFVVRIALGNIDPSTLNVLATPDNLVLQSIENAPYPRVFRAIKLPLPINPALVRAIFSNGKFFFVAPKIGVSERGESDEVVQVATATRVLLNARR